MGDFPSSGSNSSITFVGTAGYLANGPTVTLDAAEIANRSSTYTSGSLRLEGWLFSTPYQGGSQFGYEVAIAPIESTTNGTLSPDANYANLSYTVPLTGSAPPGTYYPALLLGEYAGQSSVDGGYVIDSWIDFPTTVTIGANGIYSNGPPANGNLGNGPGTGSGGAPGTLENGGGGSGASPQTIVVGSGPETISPAGNAQVFGGAGSLTFVNGAGSSTVVGATGRGADSIFGGPGGGMFAGGSGGANILVAGSGAATLFGSGPGDVLFASGSAGDELIGGPGSEILDGAFSTGNNVYWGGSGINLIWGGSGNDTFIAGKGIDTLVGGAGANLFGLINGLSSGGTDIIYGFDAAKGDRLLLSGYGAGEVQADLAGASATGAATVLTLSDNTTIVLMGVANLGPSAFA